MNYIYITYDALVEFTSGRFFQNAEYTIGEHLCCLFRGEEQSWIHNRILLKRTMRGLVFYTAQIDMNKALIFDENILQEILHCKDDRLMMLLQTVMKYAIRHFDGQKLVKREYEIPNTLISIVYPFPFTAKKSADKVYIDRNSFKEDRKGKEILTAYYFGKSQKEKFVSTCSRKAIADFANIDFNTSIDSKIDGESFLEITELDSIEMTIDDKIGYNHWLNYLTKTQSSFVKSDVKGPERLEGPAGSGKTVTMILRCVHLLKEKIAKETEYHLIFITHSLATKEHIMEVFHNVWSDIDNYIETEASTPKVSISITTLQEWCGKYIGTGNVTSEQYLDKDVADAKLWQQYHIAEAFDAIYSDAQQALEIVCSEKFRDFIKSTSRDDLLYLLQQETAVLIKGRASENLEKYKKLQRPKYAIPLENDADKEFVFSIYRKYQQALMDINKYDSDDIVLSALKNLDTPIWKRLRMRQGYDACFVDETQLFNINELSIFQYVNKEEFSNYIVYAIDKSQAVGDWGIDNEMMEDALRIKTASNMTLNVVFRNSPEIVNLAFCILSHGATLFTNFDNPLEHYTPSFTRDQEKKCTSPRYMLYMTDNKMISRTFELADEYCRETGCKHSSVLIACTSEDLFSETEKYAKKCNKPYEKLESRNDKRAIEKAIYGNKYVLGGIDLIGGLEFDALFLIGVDKSRVPPMNDSSLGASHILDYAWHNRMYVAVTRAKYSVTLVGNKAAGNSPLLENAIQQDLISVL